MTNQTETFLNDAIKESSTCVESSFRNNEIMLNLNIII